MKNTVTVLKHRWLLIAMACFISLAAVSMTGCAGKTKTTVTQTTNGTLASGASSSVTTQKEVVTDAHPRGVIGGIFYTIGQVLIFPFKVIGNLF